MGPNPGTILEFLGADFNAYKKYKRNDNIKNKI